MDGKNKKFFFVPRENPTNAYVGQMQKAFQMAGFDKVSFLKADYFSLNWIESIPNNGFISATYCFLQRLLFLVIIILRKKKIIWTYHNRRPHSNKYGYLSDILLKIIVKNAKVIIIHSKKSRNFLLEDFPQVFKKKILYIPHPNYCGVYPEEAHERVEDDIIRFTFVGAVSPYKNIESLILGFNELREKKVSLGIFGKASTDEYKKKLEEIPIGQNIKLSLEFIKDENLVDVIKQSDIIITPYYLDSVINSGTQILAMSYGKTVLTTPTCTMLDLPHELWFEIPFSASDKVEITESVKYIINHYSKKELGRIGMQLNKEMKTEYSLLRVANIIKGDLDN